jgi:hypothetical protein
MRTADLIHSEELYLHESCQNEQVLYHFSSVYACRL